jgi:hypothetical protein
LSTASIRSISHDPIKILSELHIAKFFSQELGESFDGDERVLYPMDQFNKKERQGVGMWVLRMVFLVICGWFHFTLFDKGDK